MAPTDRDVFDVGGPLPSGLWALEASAGTGKTYALSALAVRFIAERGLNAADLCIVSFTEAATAELRGRVRARLVEALDHLRHGGESVDPVLSAVADLGGDLEERERRIARLQGALADFDAATITTIHGFCSRVLAGAGLAGDDEGISDGVADIYEVVNDIYLAHLGSGAGDVDVDQLLEIDPDRLAVAVRAKLTMPDAHLHRPALHPEPVTKANAKTEQERIRRSHLAADLIDEAVVEVLHRRTVRRKRTFDGLLSATRAHLCSPEGHGTVLALRDRYRVVLIDEFQDTDRVQWDIFHRAFVADDTTVVLVGDPKQSIYRFRSAELSAYLVAVAAAGDHVATLGTNWRSDAPLLDALEHLFTGFTFGDEEVRFQPVDAAEHHRIAALDGAGEAVLDLRWVPRPVDADLTAGRARRLIRNDVVRVVDELLAGGVTVAVGEEGRRPLRARDIAILTRSNADAALLALTLGEAGVPAATASSNSVLDSDAAWQWELLLRALERPGSPGAARAAALGWFLGRDPADLIDADDEQTAALHDLLREWAVVLAERGVPHLLARARAEGLHRRLLSAAGGERHLTDLDHVAELLQAHTGGRPVSAAALLVALTELARRAGGDEVATDALARRIDRDDDAVQVLTVHKAKGLEFPVVLCPFLWTNSTGSGGIPHAHRPDTGRRELDCSWVSKIPDVKLTRQLRELARDEQHGEARRLLYVALTRARHRCVVWWPPLSTGKGAGGPLGELFKHATGLGTVPISPDEIRDVVATSGGTISLTLVPEFPGRSDSSGSASDEAVDPPDLAVSVADRELDHAWRIWSFTSVTAAAEGRAAVPAPVEGGADEPSVDDGDGGVEPASGAVATLLTTAPAGTAFGTLVHGVFEHCDFARPDLREHLRELCDEALRYRPMRVTADDLGDGLADAVEAPLGGPLGGLRLSDITRSDRLDELEFHLPLGRLRADAIGRVLAEHLAPDDPLLDWARGLAGQSQVAPVPVLTRFDVDIAGRLIGSIDLVARTSAGGVAGECRYWVADYKTNQLGIDNAYDLPSLVEAMVHHHYPLQATLYLVALHRYLRWRIPDYHPERHLGGAAYLFVRGMDPARSADAARGVFWWQPSTSAVLALDQLLADGET